MAEERLIPVPALTGEEMLTIMAALHAFKHHHGRGAPRANEVGQSVIKKFEKAAGFEDSFDTFSVDHHLLGAIELASDCELQELIGQIQVRITMARLGLTSEPLRAVVSRIFKNLREDN